VTAAVPVALALCGLLALTAGYLLLCAASPYTQCSCAGGPRRRLCRRCRGTGHRLRPGRRLINHMARTRARATGPTTRTPGRTPR